MLARKGLKAVFPVTSREKAETVLLVRIMKRKIQGKLDKMECNLYLFYSCPENPHTFFWKVLLILTAIRSIANNQILDRSKFKSLKIFYYELAVAATSSA